MRSISGTDTGQVVSRGASPSAGSDRRRHTRYPVVLGCKVRRGKVLRFDPGATVDVSRGGALVRVQDPSAFVPGESLEMGVVWDGSAVVASEAMVRGVVTRVHETDGTIAIALEGASGAGVIGTSTWAAGVAGVAIAATDTTRRAA